MGKKAIFLVLLLLLASALPLMGGASAQPGYHHLTGAVSTDLGPPLAGVTVTAVNISNGTELYSGKSSTNGSYDFEVPSGIYVISAALENYSIRASDGNKSYNRSVTSDVSKLDFTAIELGTVLGYVDNITNPIFDARIVLVGASSITYSDNSSQPRGKYTISGVLPGVYMAYAEKEGFQTNYSQSLVTVERGSATWQNFSLISQPARLAGLVTSSGNSLENVKVTLSLGDVALYQTTTDAKGDYSLSDVAAGTYLVTFTKEGYETSKVENVKLAAFDDKKLDVTMNHQLLPGGGGFIPGFDFPHSLMIIGFILAFMTVIVALIIRYRVGKKPELLPKEDIESDR